jgi:adenosylcobinamide-phosphate synthase
VVFRMSARAGGLALGVVADMVWGDPRRGHPVAGFGRAAQRLEEQVYADDVRSGALFTTVAVAVPTILAVGVERGTARRPWLRMMSTAVTTWAVLGGTGLLREGRGMARDLESNDLTGGRKRLRNLCARDATGLTETELARATVESLAENASDAVVAPLFWGAVAGVPGMIGYRAVNTLDAMVGYRNHRYRNFGRASARTDDLANYVPARIAAVLTVLAAPVVGGSPARAWRVHRRDRWSHPSPNAGQVESAAAGALGVRLGGANTYHGTTEHRAVLGDGVDPGVMDIRRAVRLTASVTTLASVLAVGVVATNEKISRRRMRFATDS